MPPALPEFVPFEAEGEAEGEAAAAPEEGEVAAEAEAEVEYVEVAEDGDAMEVVAEGEGEVIEAAEGEAEVEAEATVEAQEEGVAVEAEEAPAEAEVVAEETAVEEVAEVAADAEVYVEDVTGGGDVAVEELAEEAAAEEAAGAGEPNDEDQAMEPVASDEAGLAADAAADALAVQDSLAEEPAEDVARSKAYPSFKGKGKGKNQSKGGTYYTKGKGKENGKSGPKGKEPGGPPGAPGADVETFYGLIYQVGAKTGNMLIKSWRATQKFGQEVMLPATRNPTNAKVGDKVSFQVMPGKEGGRPIATNVGVRGHVDQFQLDKPEAKEGSLEDIRRQVLYYFSDDNLRQDKFFSNIIATTEGGWISMPTILGCPRMEKMGATCQSVIEAMRGATEVEVREGPPGEEAIRRTTQAPALDASATAGQASSLRPADAPPSSSDLFYAGVVKAKRGWKYFVQCDAIRAAYAGKDAWFEPKQKPEGVDAGSHVVFTLAPGSDPGFAPKAGFVARLAPPGGLVGGAAEGDAALPPGPWHAPPGAPRPPLKRKAPWA